MKEERINKPPILKVGDRVRVKSIEWFNAQEKDSDGDILLRELTPDGHYFTKKMIEHCGEEFYITRIEDRESVPYYKFRDSSFSWEFWMFDLIEESEYKVGDKIIVNSIEWYNENKDDCGVIDLENGGNFVEGMKENCGKVFTISDSYERDNQIYYHFKGTSWAWQSWMFSLVKKEVSNALYHVGEKVTINSKIWLAAQRLDGYGTVVHSDSSDTCLFTSEMAKYCGRTVTIDKVKANAFNRPLYTFKEIPYIWHSWMFVPTFEVEEHKELKKLVDKKSELTEYQIGDTVKTPMGNEAIIISNSLSGYYDIVYTSGYRAGYLDKTDSETTLLEAGKYKDLINTELSPDIIARSLRNRFGIIAKSKSLSKEVEAMPKEPLSSNEDSNSQSNSSEFDLTKVIYKSKRIY